MSMIWKSALPGSTPVSVTVPSIAGESIVPASVPPSVPPLLSLHATSAAAAIPKARSFICCPPSGRAVYQIVSMGIGKFAALAIALVSTNAFADGAFPDEQSIFFFDTAPEQIVVGTNFGLMISEDNGKSWLTACEASISPTLVNFYQAGPDGDGWIYAATANDLLASSDVACSWTKSSGTFAGQISDVFADQAKAGRVYAISSIASASTVQRSEDFAATFAPFFSEMNGAVTGVEPARSMPTTLYVAGSHAGVAYVAQSIDDGKTFTTFMHPEIKAILRIAAV